MRKFKEDFLNFVIENEILSFGKFTLKSGRISPYFFNAGLFNTGEKLSFLARCYADAIVGAGIEYDILFGPAYKGIPLATATSMALANEHKVNKPYCFNRKELKAHGEGGSIVGAQLSGGVLIVDDVITAGTAIREAAEIISSYGAHLNGIVVAMDRQEKGAGNLSAIQEIEQGYQIKIVSIVSLQDIVNYLTASENKQLQPYLDAVASYREEYGIAV